MDPTKKNLLLGLRLPLFSILLPQASFGAESKEKREGKSVEGDARQFLPLSRAHSYHVRVSVDV